MLNITESLSLIKSFLLESSDTWVVALATPTLRIRYLQHPSHVILIEEIPQKGQKTVRSGHFDSSVFSRQWMDDILKRSNNLFMVENLIPEMKISSSMTFDSAVKSLFNAFSDAKLSAMKTSGVSEAWFKDYDWKRSFYERDVAAIEVEPADYKPINVKGKDFDFVVKWDGFTIYDPKSDFQSMDASYTGYSNATKASARKMYKLLKLNPNDLSNVSYRDVSKWLDTNKVAKSSIHSSWR